MCMVSKQLFNLNLLVLLVSNLPVIMALLSSHFLFNNNLYKNVYRRLEVTDCMDVSLLEKYKLS